MRIPFDEDNISILEPNIEEEEYYRTDLKHPNHLIDRNSIKLNRDGWLKTLFFFKAAPGKKNELEKTLVTNFLGVDSNRFSRKLYHMTGDYDFMVPFDCSHIDELTKVIDKFTRNHGKYITNFTNTVCRPDTRGDPELLGPLDIPIIESLLINSTKIAEFEKKIKTENFLNNIVGAIGDTPREDYLRNKFNNEDQDIVKNYLMNLSIRKIGIESTIEFKDGALIQIFMKYYFENIEQKNSLINEINKRKNDFDIISTIYEPVRDPLTVMSILMVKDFVELEMLLDDFRQCCKKIEFHVIFHQQYYSKVIEQSIICKPCFYPHKTQNCGICIRYILPRKKDRTLNINFNNKIKNEIVISLVGIDLNIAKYFGLEQLLDNEKIRNEILQKYEEEIKRKKTNENIDEIKKEYYEITKKRDNYKTAVIKILQKVVSDNPDIIIFPEYAIPLYVFNEIEKFELNYECVIVAGSHIDNRYNVCPIIFNKSENNKNIYYIYKNNISPLEEKLGIINKTGTAHLKFLNTKWGNLLVKICYDAFITSMGGGFEKVDILLVPSFNPSNDFKDSIEGKVKDYKLVAAYANTINEGKIKSNFFIPSDNGLKAGFHNLEPFHKESWSNVEEDKSSKIIFRVTPEKNRLSKITEEGFNFRIKKLTFNVLELDKRRNIRSKQ